jgi:hypothetical protein
MRRLALLLILSLFAVPGLTIARVQREQLDPRIKPPVTEKYRAVQDAKDWLNPYLVVCADGVHLTAHKQTSLVPTQNLRAALVKLPLEAWPYGRVVAVQDCSIVAPADRDRGERIAEVEALLKPLKLMIEKWPS